MRKIFSFIQQQIFPGFYASYANKIISKNYKKQQDFEVDISLINGNNKEYIKQLKLDLDNQLERKKRIEDKAKSLLFIIAVAITAITFSLNYLNSLTIDIYQIISISIVFLSIIYLVIGAIRALQTLNIRQFNVNQANVIKNDNKYILKNKKTDDDYLKDIIKSKQLNDLINIRLSNYTYASFNLIRNGIILFVLFFITTISFSYYSKNEKNSGTHIIEKKIKFQINDTINMEIPYKFEIKYDIKNFELEKGKDE